MRAAVSIRACMLSLVVCALVLSSCAETSRSFVSLPMFAEREGDTSFEVDGFEVALSRAEVAVGPIYFCATAAADADLCPVAVAELREVAVIDLLDDGAQGIGTATATTGMVRSATLDYGRPFLLSENEPGPGPRALDAHSAVFEGEACREEACFTFVANVDITGREPGDSALPGLDTTFAISEEPQRLTLRADPSAWLERIDFAELASTTSDEVVAIEPGSQAYEAIVLAMTSRAVPDIAWSE